VFEHCELKHNKNIALAMLGDTRSPLAYRSRGVWLLCSFQGPSEKGRGRSAATGAARERTVSQNSTACSLKRDGMPHWQGLKARSTC